MEKKEIYRRAFTLALPMMLQNAITNAVALVDNIMVGNFGTESITAVSIIGQFLFVFQLGVFGAISGPGIYGAQFFGKNNMEGVKNSFRMKLWLSFGFLLLSGIILFEGAEPLIEIYMKGGSDTINQSLVIAEGTLYLKWIMISFVPFIVSQAYASTMREIGDSMIPMIAGFGAVLVDVIGNYVLIYGKCGFPVLGVQGAAIATIVARVVEALMVILFAHLGKRHKDVFNGIYDKIFIPRKLAMQMIQRGIPIFFNEFLWAGAMVSLAQCYSSRGLEVVASLNMCVTLCNLFAVVYTNLGMAVGILIGQLLGKGSFQEARKHAFILADFSAKLCIVLLVIVVGLAFIFPSCYQVSDKIKEYAKWLIIITAFSFPVEGILNAFYFTIRAGGRTGITFLFDSVFSWGICYVAAFALCRYTSLSIFMIFAIIKGLDMGKAMIGYILLGSDIWLQNLAEQ